MSRWFGPKEEQHLGPDMKCRLCERHFQVGDITGLVAVEPADEEARAKKDAGRPYTARAVEVHRECILACVKMWQEASDL